MCRINPGALPSNQPPQSSLYPDQAAVYFKHEPFSSLSPGSRRFHRQYYLLSYIIITKSKPNSVTNTRSAFFGKTIYLPDHHFTQPATSSANSDQNDQSSHRICGHRSIVSRIISLTGHRSNHGPLQDPHELSHHLPLSAIWRP